MKKFKIPRVVPETLNVEDIPLPPGPPPDPLPPSGFPVEVIPSPLSSFPVEVELHISFKFLVRNSVYLRFSVVCVYLFLIEIFNFI